MKNMQFETTVILESETYSILSGDFEADGFSSGYVLFQALIQAYTKSTISETMEFKPWLSKIYSRIPWLNEKVKADFDFTSRTYFDNKSKRHSILEWYHTHPCNNVLELELNENSFSVIFSVEGEDYDVGYTSGWDTFDDHQNITNAKVPLLSNYLNDDSFGFNTMINGSVYDADGKCIFLKQDCIKNFSDVIIVDRLMQDIDDSILDEYNFKLINENLLRIVNALGFK